jgi:hypothetical protein
MSTLRFAILGTGFWVRYQLAGWRDGVLRPAEPLRSRSGRTRRQRRPRSGAETVSRRAKAVKPRIQHGLFNTKSGRLSNPKFPNRRAWPGPLRGPGRAYRFHRREPGAVGLRRGEYDPRAPTHLGRKKHLDGKNFKPAPRQPQKSPEFSHSLAIC